MLFSRNHHLYAHYIISIAPAYRGHVVRKEMGPLIKGEMDQETKNFIKFYCSKWRSKSMFQVLLRYRAARYQDFVQLSQQVLLFLYYYYYYYSR